MFRAARCSSSGGPIVSPQHLVSSPSVSSPTVCRRTADCMSGMQEHMLLHTTHSTIQINKYQSWSCSKAAYKPVWHIPLLSVQWINSWWWTEKLSETCRVSWQNKFVKLVHLVRFITKKCYDARPHERKIYCVSFRKLLICTGMYTSNVHIRSMSVGSIVSVLHCMLSILLVTGTA